MVRHARAMRPTNRKMVEMFALPIGEQTGGRDAQRIEFMSTNTPRPTGEDFKLPSDPMWIVSFLKIQGQRMEEMARMKRSLNGRFGLPKPSSAGKDNATSLMPMESVAGQ
jgi:hypothetical protein